MDLIKSSVMTAASTVNDQELVSYGLVDSSSVNLIDDLIPSELTESELSKEKNDFANTFICHLIFYVIFCISLVLHILIDLGLGSFIRNKFIQIIDLRQKIVYVKSPAFA